MTPTSLVIALILITTACDQNHSAPPSPTIHGIGQAIDGDSLTVNSIEIRLWAIDAVEYKQTCFRDSKTWACGKAAKAALTRKLKNTPLSCQQKDKDPYGRIVAECFINGESLNSWLVRHGWALAYRRYSQKFIEAERIAKAQQQGIWASTFTEPWHWRQQQAAQ